MAESSGALALLKPSPPCADSALMTKPSEHPNPHTSNAIVALMQAEARKGQVPIALLIKLLRL